MIVLSQIHYTAVSLRANYNNNFSYMAPRKATKAQFKDKNCPNLTIMSKTKIINKSFEFKNLTIKYQCYVRCASVVFL